MRIVLPQNLKTSLITSILMLAGMLTGFDLSAQIRTGLPLGRSSQGSWYKKAGNSRPQWASTRQLMGDAKTVKPIYSYSKRRVASQNDTLALDPVLGFYDDFANAFHTPDTNKWVKGSGVYINNTFAVRQPNFNVATFDGLRPNGTPYDTVRTGIAGYCDTLTSLPIDLFSIPVAQVDSLVLSFDYQIGGPKVQFMPELFDSLNLYFKTPQDTNWTKVWYSLGDTFPINPATRFRQAAIRIPTRFQVYGFQFRFVNYGSRNGTGDLFQLDNVYLNTGRDSAGLGRGKFRDIAAAKATPYLLYPYTQVPRRHLNTSNCLQPVKDSLSATFSTLNNYTSTAQEVPYTISITVQDSVSGRLIEKNADPFQIASSFEGLGYFSFLRPFRTPEERVEVRLATAGLDSLKAFLSRPDTLVTKLFTRYTLPDQDLQNNPYRLNDTITTITELGDAYAYDDGSAEMVRWTGGNNARLAQEFRLCTKDSLRAVRILFPKTLQNTFPGRTISFTLYVWPKLLPVRTNVVDRFYASIPVNVNPAQVKDGFATIRLFRPVMIDTGTYFIGWQQGVGIENEVRVGLDIDAEPGYKVWYNVSGNWVKDTTDKHPLCIRPVFGNSTGLLTTLPQAQFKEVLSIWPNPLTSTGQLNFSELLDRVVIRNLAGQTVFETHHADGLSSVRLSNIPAGIYFLTGTKRSQQSQCKLIVH